MRANKRKSLDVALTAAWEKVFEQTKSESLEDFFAEGWMTVELAAKKAGKSESAVRHHFDRMVKSNSMEKKTIRAQFPCGARTANIYRPLI